MITIVVVDDHHLVRQGICALLADATGVRVVGQASDGREAIAMAETLTPNLMLIDISMPEMDGIQAAEYICTTYPHIGVIMLSMHDKPSVVRRVLRLGIKGYLLKNAVTEELMLAIAAARRGEVYLSPSISHALADQVINPIEESNQKLTRREHEVLQLISEGLTNGSIATKLDISIKTVEKHRSNVMKKLQVTDLPALMRVAIQRNLIFLD